jgi:chaperonin GroEL (HSP60 family)
VAGDGTTTATLLAQSIVQEGMTYIPHIADAISR